jgi:hypothetical protein
MPDYGTNEDNYRSHMPTDTGEIKTMCLFCDDGEIRARKEFNHKAKAMHQLESHCCAIPIALRG